MNVKTKKIITYVAVYTGVFTVCFVLAFFWFFKMGKSFIWKSDGLFMHYNFLGYMGECLRKIVDLLHEGNLTLPMWGYEFGYGSDIFAVFNARIGDPLNYISILFPREDIEILHNFLAVFRIYLMGITFSIFSFKHKNDRFPTLVGAMVYCFSGLILWVGLRHLYFVNPMIYLPLLLLGAENVLYKKKGKLFTFMIFLSAIGNFYFFYMLTLGAVLYVFISFLLEKYKNPIKEFFVVLFRFIRYYLLGICFAAPIFLPVINAYLSSGRSGVGYGGSLLHRSFTFYVEFLYRWISQGFEYGEATGYIPLALIAVIVLYTIKNTKLNKVKILFVTATIFLLIPFFGFAFNGFSYITNRWIFEYSMIVAYVTTCSIPYMWDLRENKKAKYAISVIVAILAIGCIFSKRLNNLTFVTGVMMLALWAIVVLVVFPMLSKRKNGKIISYFVMIILVFISVWVNGDTRFSPDKENYISEYVDMGAAEDILTSTAASAALQVDQTSDFYRIDETDTERNTQAAQHYNGVSFYTSLLNAETSDFHNMLNVSNATYAQTFNFKGLDRRAYLEVLQNVKYYATTADDTEIPYGFGPVTEVDSNGNIAYLNYNFVPLGYTYSSYMSLDDFEELTPVQRQQAMLQSIIIDDDNLSYAKGTPVYTDEEISYTMTCSDGITVNGNKIIVENTSAYIMLTFEGLIDSETYLSINGFNMESVKGEEDDIYWEPETSTYIKAYTDNFSGLYSFRTSSDKAYTGIHDYLINMGHTYGAKKWCRIGFSKTGVYTYDDIKIYCQPMGQLSEYVSNLSEDVLDVELIESNHIIGDIQLEENKILYLSIPYSKGWTLYVDGKEESIIKGNVMGMAVTLDSGSHHIELVYRTPGLMLGIIVFIITAIGSGVYFILSKLKSRVRKKDD